MRERILGIGAGLALALAGLVAPASAAATQNECDAARPQAELPGSSTTEAAPDTANDATLTEKLATCGSVLNPLPLGRHRYCRADAARW